MGLEVESLTGGQGVGQPSLCDEASVNPPREGVESSRVGEPGCFRAPLCWAPNSARTEVPLFETSPCVFLHLAFESDPLISFIINSLVGDQVS